MLAYDWAQKYFCAQSETSIRISRRIGALRMASWRLSHPFFKTFDAFRPT